MLEGGTTFVAGEVGQAFSFNGVDADVWVPGAPNLNVGAGDGLTIEGWINPAEVNSQHPIAEWSSPSWFNAHFWIATPVAFGGGGPGSLYANLIDTTSAYHQIASAGGVVIANTYQHVAVTYDKGSGSAVLYLNGVVVEQANLGSFTPLTTGDLHLGLRPVGGAAGTRFVGQMDEMAIYNRALRPDEIAAIYGAGSAGKCAAPPPPPQTNCVSAPSGLVSWWRAEGNAKDSAGRNNGRWSTDRFHQRRGGPGLCFRWSRDAVIVPNAPAVNFGAGQDFSIEAWVKPLPSSTEYGVMTIVEKRFSPSWTQDVGYEVTVIYGQ